MYMLKMTHIVLGLLLLAGAPASAAQTLYSGVIEDLPLMPGMVEKADDAVVFDKPAGRIIETCADAPLSAAPVIKFYTETLPEIGWKARGSEKFVRDGEALSFRLLRGKTSGSRICFTLKPDSEEK